MKVLFAPDYRAGVAYQALLAEALQTLGVEVEYLQTYKRLLPLARQIPQRQAEVLHLHWPEAYFRVSKDWRDAWRQCRFPVDLRWGRTGKALVTTAHNIYPHDLKETALGLRAERSAYKQADVIIAHSNGARDALRAKYGLEEKQFYIIPHGSFGGTQPVPLPLRADARKRLGWPQDTPILSMIGRVQEYKGIEESVRYWIEAATPGWLVIAGEPADREYQQKLESMASKANNIYFHFERLSESDYRDVMAASSCVLFNYKRILTSGAASYARECGVPIALPVAIDTLDLHEPADRVFRFRNYEELPGILERAHQLGTCFEGATNYRNKISWMTIAEATLQAYRTALAHCSTLPR